MAGADWRASRLAPRRGAVSRAQVEIVAGRALGAFGLVFGAQTVPMAIDQAPFLVEGAGAAMMALLYGAIAALAVATFTRLAVRAAALAFAGLYVLCLIAWPVLVVDTAGMQGETPWLYYLCTVATTASVVAVPVAPAAAYTIAAASSAMTCSTASAEAARCR